MNEPRPIPKINYRAEVKCGRCGNHVAFIKKGGRWVCYPCLGEVPQESDTAAPGDRSEP